MVACLDNDNTDYFYVDFILAHLLEYLLEGTLSGKYILNHGYMKKIVCSKTYLHFYHDQNYKTTMIYQDTLNYGRDRSWYNTYTHFYHHHKHFIHHCERNIG